MDHSEESAKDEGLMTSSIPTGEAFLQAVRGLENRCEALFDEWSTKAGGELPQTIEVLGTAFSYLDQIASCLWGCRDGDHVIEYLLGRATSNGMAAYRLLRAGYYDESFSMIRQMGETANLLCLFMQSPESYGRWLQTNEQDRKRHFRPVKVRLRLEKLPLPMPMDEDLYRHLSGLSVHVSPTATPQSYNLIGQPTMGGYFQKEGAQTAFNHLSDMIVYLLGFSSLLLQEPSDRKTVIDAMVELGLSTSDEDVVSITNRWIEIRKMPEFQDLTVKVRLRDKKFREGFNRHRLRSGLESPDKGRIS